MNQRFILPPFAFILLARMEEIRIQIKRVRMSREPLALPAYMTEGSAGMDLSADLDQDLLLAPLERTLIPTGIAVALP